MCPPSATKSVAAYCDSAEVAPSGEASVLALPHAPVGKPSCLGSTEMLSEGADFSGQGRVSVGSLVPLNMLSGLSPEMASSLRPSRVSPGSEQDTEMRAEAENEEAVACVAETCTDSDVCAELDGGSVSCETHVTSTPVATTGGEDGDSQGSCSDTDGAESDDFSTCVVSVQPSAGFTDEAGVCRKSESAFFGARSSCHVRVAHDPNDPESVSNGDDEAVPTPQCRLSIGLTPKDQAMTPLEFEGEDSDHGLLVLHEEDGPTCCQDATDDAEDDTPRGGPLYRGESDCIGSYCGFERHREEGEEAGETDRSLGEAATGLSCLPEENDDPSVPDTPRGCLCRVNVDFEGGVDNCCVWSKSECGVELHTADKTMGKLFTSLEYFRHQEQSCSLESDPYESEDETAHEHTYASPRCFPSMPPEEAFSRQETVFIFDWDDTLLPSSWISQKGLTLESAESEVSLWRMKLAQTAMWAEQTLFTARTLGQVIIVTNAESGWIDLSCSKFLPGLREMLNCFPIVSARSMYESAWCNTPFLWKEAAFMHELQRHFRMESKRWNVISVGDSTHEREALLAVCSRLRKMYHVTTKSLKLLESPAVEELHSQHELMSKCLAAVARHKGNLDLCVTNAAEPEIDPAAVKLPPALQGRTVGVHRIRHHPLSQELIGRA